jgi:hypothetical protein
MSELAILALAAPFITLSLGILIGRRLEAHTWVDGAKHGTTVPYRGKLYGVWSAGE